MIRIQRPLISFLLIALLTVGFPLTGYTTETPAAKLNASFSAGQTAFLNQHYPQAEQNFKVALENAKAVRNAQLFAISYSYLGFAQVYQDKLESAQANLKNAEKIAAIPGITPVAKMLNLLAYIEYDSRMGDIGQAQKHIQTILTRNDADFRAVGMTKTPLRQAYKSNQILEKKIAALSVTKEADNYFDDALLNGNVMHWNDETRTIKVYISSGLHIPGWNPAYAENFKQACLVWQSALNNKIRFEFVKDVSEPVDTVITWHADKNMMPALTELSMLGNKLVKADIAFHLIDNSNQLYDPRAIYKLSLHELGHLLGISGHSRNPNDIMFPATTYAIEPSTRDVSTLLELYSRPAIITTPNGMTLREYRKEALSQGQNPIKVFAH